MNITYTDPNKILFFHVVAVLYNALFTSFDKLLYSSRNKSLCLLSKPEIQCLLHLVAVKPSCSQCFIKLAKHMIVGLSEVWSVRAMDGGNCCSSSVWSRIVMEEEGAFGQKSATTANCTLQFFFRNGALPYTVDCLSFLLKAFENWSIHIPEQCQHKFSGRGCRLELFLDRTECVSPFHGLPFGFRFIMMNTGFIPRDNGRKKPFTLIMVTCQESSATRHTLQLLFVNCLSTHLEHSDV
jgi:hypothetical protein